MRTYGFRRVGAVTVARILEAVLGPNLPIAAASGESLGFREQAKWGYLRRNRTEGG